MKIEIQRRKKFPIIVSQEELRKLSEFLTANYTEFEIEAKCIDGSTFTSVNIEEIINFENPSLRKIKSIAIKFGKSYRLGGSVDFSEELFETCSFTVNEDDDSKALKIAHEIEFRLNECKAWYSLLMYIRPISIALVIPILLSVVIAWVKFFRNDYKFDSSNSSSIAFWDGFYLALPIILIFGLIVYFIDKYWFWLFPKVWFDIGKQKNELSKRVKVRNYVFAGIIATILIGIITNLITNLISR